ncbi:hypothetical protein [Enhygromyxa salina]|uniref:hypothetical protein n=1 Tax=Enhygromyxa salina TaxID=215803 RepID=UPI0006962972|nr:hypothetical protein [Enhygromyxa salina]
MLPTTVMALVLSASPTYPPPQVVADEYTTSEGRRTRWASVTYTLPDGRSAEVVLVADDAARGDGYLFVEGEVIVHATYDDTIGLDSWTTSTPGGDALAAAALFGLSGAPGHALLDAFTEGPQAFPCSEFGKGVLKAARYMWTGMVAASGAACCGATAGSGCILCAGAAAIANEVGKDALNNYCD